jgi:hypothetical protein
MLTIRGFIILSYPPRYSALARDCYFLSSMPRLPTAMRNAWVTFSKLLFLKIENSYLAERYVFGEEIVEIIVDSGVIDASTKSCERKY